MLDKIELAIKERRVITCTCDGYDCTGEPHLLGTEGNTHSMTIELYQTHGGSSRGVIPAWRHLEVADISNLVVTTETFIPRSDFNPNRGRWHTVLCRV